MSFLEKAQSLIILAAVFTGLALGTVPGISRIAGTLILPFLVVMLTGVFLNVPLRRFADVLRHGRVAIASLTINFLWTPALAWVLGWFFLRDQPLLWIGFLMLLVTPCTDWYLVFTGIARGNLALSTTLLPVNLVLQILFLPLYILLLAGAVLPIDPRLLAESVATVLLLPLGTAVVLRRVLVRWKGVSWMERRLLPAVQSGQILFLGLAIAAMFASEGRVIAQNPWVLLRLLIPLLLFFCINTVLSLVTSRALKSDYGAFVSLSFLTLARNSPIALAIALAAFPDQPLVALALVIGPLIELPVLGLIAQVLLWFGRRGLFPSSGHPG